MQIFGVKLIHDFARQHANARSHLIAWLNETEKVNWQGPNDIKALHATASFLSDNRIVFNIKGNSYRLLVQVNYRRSFVTVLQVGTHAEYNKWKL